MPSSLARVALGAGRPAHNTNKGFRTFGTAILCIRHAYVARSTLSARAGVLFPRARGFATSTTAATKTPAAEVTTSTTTTVVEKARTPKPATAAKTKSKKKKKKTKAATGTADKKTVTKRATKAAGTRKRKPASRRKTAKNSAAKKPAAGTKPKKRLTAVQKEKHDLVEAKLAIKELLTKSLVPPARKPQTTVAVFAAGLKGTISGVAEMQARLKAASLTEMRVRLFRVLAPLSNGC